MAAKLNSMRMLEHNKIDYTVRAFPDTIHSAAGVADYFGLSPEMVYKTLVVRAAPGKPILVLVAGCRELDLKKMAQAIGQKRVHMATHKEAEQWTGLQTGGISPLALLHKNFPVYIDRLALDLTHILVSAGKRGINLELSVPDLFKVTQARAIDATSAGVLP
jgi:Cys-tRNA(Pro)/Cys-tRNA(Cys) deacylase